MDRSTGLSFHDEDLAVTNPELTDTKAPPLPSSTQTQSQPPLLPSSGDAGLGLRDGPPYGATASSARHRMMMPFTGHALQAPSQPALLVPLPGMPVPDPSPDALQGPHAHTEHGTRTADHLSGQASPPERHQGHRDHQGPGLVPHQTLQPPPSHQPTPDWFLLDSSAPTFPHPVDPFLSHPGPNIANFALGFHGHAFEYPEDTHGGTVLPPHLPLSGPNSAVNFDFDFPLPQWEPTFADGIPLPDVQPDEASAYTRPEPGHAMAVETFGPEMPWFEEDPTSLTTGNHTFTPPARVARKKTKKDKDRADSTASGSAYSASIASTQEAFPFPDPSPNPSNPLNPPTNRRRSTRTKGRAKSVTTTTSASSSSTAPTPGTRSQPSASEQQPPSNASRLRSASRASKNSVSRPSDTLEDRRTRASHNLVEKQYRSRLNAQFEGLLCALPDPEEDVKTEPGVGPADDQDAADKKVSKAEVLERARVHIETLERQSEALTRQREALLESLGRVEREMASSSGAGDGRRVRDGDGAPLERWGEKGVKEEGFGEES